MDEQVSVLGQGTTADEIGCPQTSRLEQPTICLNDLLACAGLNSSDVVVARHKPKESRLNRVLPWLVAERPDLFSLYQSVQDSRAAASFRRRRYLASFLGLKPGQGVFAGLYLIGDGSPMTAGDYQARPGQAELFELGLSDQPASPSTYFPLCPITGWDDWIGRLVIIWPGKELSWLRLAERNVMQVRSITEESQFAKAMPHWTELSLSWAQLQVLPTSWRGRLAEWRGIYFVFDSVRNAGYVGSAAGSENLLGRWLEYGRTGHGGNKRLRASEPHGLRFSILQRTSPDMSSSDVLVLEANWKLRLHTREYGLNAN